MPDRELDRRASPFGFHAGNTGTAVGYTRQMRLKAKFIEPMLLLKTDALPNDASRWEYQIKLDGYRAIAFKTGVRE
jgi:ATP-dependent DNA ligase